jgi:hypothetical protein
MRTAAPERRAPRSNPFDAGAAGFADRHLTFRHERLRRRWSGCPACGGLDLQVPTGADRRRIPEADGICATCGAALMAASSGCVRVLVARRPRPV